MTGSRLTEWRRLVDWSAGHGLRLAEEQVDQLATYLEVLQLWNQKIALVAQKEAAEIICKHFADSLFVAAHCGDAERLIDLGSGAGFPGLPIAIARSATHVQLVESRGKKASFLERVCQIAAIHNAVVCNARIEALAGQAEHRGRYSIVTGRALASAARFLALATPFLQRGGRLIAMRSVNEPPPESSDVEEIRYELPDGTPRRLIVTRL
ncbi:MAG: 16S rRNA (guanine(527)-N(7))-methyltransferase RsmG [Mycobacteriales bacterium]